MSKERSTAIEGPSLDARIRLYQSEQNPTLLGFADLVIDGSFIIKGIVIRASKEDPANHFVLFPSKKGTGSNSDKYYDIAHPITTEAHQRAKELILEKYEEAVHGNA